MSRVKYAPLRLIDTPLLSPLLARVWFIVTNLTDNGFDVTHPDPTGIE